MIKKKGISLAAQKSIYGYLFITPFIIGCLVFFISPFIFYVFLAFSKINMTNNGMNLVFNGLDNFKEMLINYKDYITNVFGNILNLIYTVPSIVLYSFFIAIILNQKFKGRFLARAIFFLPVIIASGSVGVFNTDSLSNAAKAIVDGLNQSNAHAGTKDIYGVVMSLFGENQYSSMLITQVNGIVGRIYDITFASGVQILICLAGLQTIPPSLYEASRIDGASGWENFWKITLPMLSPILLVNTVYTIIDCLAGPENNIVQLIYNTALNSDYTISASMGIIYFALIYTIFGAVLFFMSKMVYYEDR